MTPDEILKALDNLERRDPDMVAVKEAATLIRQLQDYLKIATETIDKLAREQSRTETIHDRDARAAMATLIADPELAASNEDYARWAFEHADRMAAERARRAKEAK